MSDTHAGGCHCGAIRYQLTGPPKDVVLCHCEDCRRNAGAPVMAWAAYAEDRLKLIKGEPKVFNGAGATRRGFCAHCSTGLFYRNAEIVPGIVEVQLSSMDDAERLAPTLQIQVAERLGWMQTAHTLPEIQRFPE